MRSHPIALLPLLWAALSVTSCRTPETTSASSEPMTISFEPATMTRTGTRLMNGYLQCPVDITILAHGRSDHLVTLVGITSTFADTTGAATSALHSSVIDWFGVVQMRRDDTAVSHRLPAAPWPFTFTSTLAYTDQFGTPKAATFMLRCSD